MGSTYSFGRGNHLSPEPGDLIEISHFLYSHWAVYIGDDDNDGKCWVIHIGYSEVGSGKGKIK